MAVYRQVYITFWQDPFIMDLTPEEKYFYLYLMTNSKTKQCGCYELPKRIMEFETGYNRETVDKLIDRFVEYGKIKYDETTNEMLLINWIKFNPINNINIEKCVEKELSLIKSKPLLKLLEGLIRGYDTPTKKEEKEEEKEEEEKKPRAGKFIPPTVTEVSSYCKERKNDVDAERFCDFYQSKNWYVGKNKMRDWRAAVRTWEKKETTRHVITGDDVERDRQRKLKELEGS
jgi:hypothetical protein